MQLDKKTVRSLFALVLSAFVLYGLFFDTERVAAFAGNVWKMISPFAVGAAIAFIFNVPMRAFERQLTDIRQPGARRITAIFLTLLTLALLVAFVVLLLIPQIGMTVESIVARLPDFVRREVNNIMGFLDGHPEIKGWILQYTDFESIDWASLVEKVVSFAGNSISTIFGGAFSAIGSVTSGIVNAFLSIAFAFYSLARKEILARQGRRILYSLLSEQAADETIRVLRLTNSTFSNFISGQCLEACILGGMFAVSMALLKLPYIALVSVIISVTALIPLVGAFMGCIIGALFILVESPVDALIFVALFLILQQVEGNLIYPRVVGTSIGLPGMWVLVALSVGGEIMGVGGMLVMIPLTAVAYTLLGEFTTKQVELRQIPEEKLMDHPPELRSGFKAHRERKRRAKLSKKMKSLAEKYAESQRKEKEKD